MPISDTQKVQIRRFLGYPVAGLLQVSPAGGTLGAASAGYRFFQSWGFLEYKMNNLNPTEEAVLLGQAIGAVAFVGAQPAAGDSANVTLSGGPLVNPVTLTVIAPPPQQNIDGRLTMCNLLASSAAQSAVLRSAGIYAATPFGTGPYAQTAIPLPEVSFVCPQSFSIAVGGSGNAIPMITATGSLVPPIAQLDGITNTYGYIPIMVALEGAYYGASQNLDTSKADVWTARSTELAQRMSLRMNLQQELAQFLGTKVNPDWKHDAKNYGYTRYV